MEAWFKIKPFNYHYWHVNHTHRWMIYINMATTGLAPFAMTCSNFVLSGGGFVICLDVLCALGVLKLSGDHRVKALTGPADHCRHDPQ
ncbi:MAG: hypothetical protein JRE56_12210 [Deltaproteobacteria bacterium]|jgi:uncharacterized protein (UPF0303 family)|nr:hypothetical protein [Deltaproteobacteria bacterium]